MTDIVRKPINTVELLVFLLSFVHLSAATSSSFAISIKCHNAGRVKDEHYSEILSGTTSMTESSAEKCLFMKAGLKQINMLHKRYFNEMDKVAR